MKLMKLSLNENLELAHHALELYWDSQLNPFLYSYGLIYINGHVYEVVTNLL